MNLLFGLATGCHDLVMAGSECKHFLPLGIISIARKTFTSHLKWLAVDKCEEPMVIVVQNRVLGSPFRIARLEEKCAAFFIKTCHSIVRVQAIKSVKVDEMMHFTTKIHAINTTRGDGVEYGVKTVCFWWWNDVKSVGGMAIMKRQD